MENNKDNKEITRTMMMSEMMSSNLDYSPSSSLNLVAVYLFCVNDDIHDNKDDDDVGLMSVAVYLFRVNDDIHDNKEDDDVGLMSGNLDHSPSSSP